MTQGIIQKALRRGLIKVNSKKAEAGLRIGEGDEIFISPSVIPVENISVKKNYPPSVISLAEKIIGKYLIYDSPFFIAINKPSGLACQGGSKVGISIDEALKYLNRSEGADFKPVHRLDKETGGILLIAKNYEASVKLTEAFRDKKIEKTYLALVSGRFPEPSGSISFPIEEEKGKLKEALTEYKTIEFFPEGNFSSVEFYPVTGRKNQIRIHCARSGRPIIGDRKYGEASPGLRRMFLHAQKVLIPAEIFGECFSIERKPPDYFRDFVQSSGLLTK